MRRIVFLGMGAIECGVAVVLLVLGFQIPGRDEISHGFQRAERVTCRATDQVQIFRRQIEELRRPELMQLAERLQSQTRTVTNNVKNQSIDFNTIQAMRDALAEIATTLDGLARNPIAEGKAGLSPDVRDTLQRSATLLRTSSNQINKALEHRDGYEETVKQSVALAEMFVATLPLLTEQLDNRLAEEDHALTELGNSLDEVQNALPEYSRMTADVLFCGRLLAWLGSALAAMHAGYLILSASLGRRYSL